MFVRKKASIKKSVSVYVQEGIERVMIVTVEKKKEDRQKKRRRRTLAWL